MGFAWFRCRLPESTLAERALPSELIARPAVTGTRRPHGSSAINLHSSLSSGHGNGSSKNQACASALLDKRQRYWVWDPGMIVVQLGSETGMGHAWQHVWVGRARRPKGVGRALDCARKPRAHQSAQLPTAPSRERVRVRTYAHGRRSIGRPEDEQSGNEVEGGGRDPAEHLGPRARPRIVEHELTVVGQLDNFLVDPAVAHVSARG